MSDPISPLGGGGFLPAPLSDPSVEDEVEEAQEIKKMWLNHPRKKRSEFEEGAAPSTSAKHVPLQDLPDPWAVEIGPEKLGLEEAIALFKKTFPKKTPSTWDENTDACLAKVANLVRANTPEGSFSHSYRVRVSPTLARTSALAVHRALEAFEASDRSTEARQVLNRFLLAPQGPYEALASGMDEAAMSAGFARLTGRRVFTGKTASVYLNGLVRDPVRDETRTVDFSDAEGLIQPAYRERSFRLKPTPPPNGGDRLEWTGGLELYGEYFHFRFRFLPVGEQQSSVIITAACGRFSNLFTTTFEGVL